jgi:hypothetical protein
VRANRRLSGNRDPADFYSAARGAGEHTGRPIVRLVGPDPLKCITRPHLRVVLTGSRDLEWITRRGQGRQSGRTPGGGGVPAVEPANNSIVLDTPASRSLLDRY